MPHETRAPHGAKFGVPVQGAPCCASPGGAEGSLTMTAGGQPKRLGLEVRFDREPIEGQLYDRDDDRGIARSFAGWLGLMSAIDDARQSQADEEEGKQ
jgi:hypothetical protein